MPFLQTFFGESGGAPHMLDFSGEGLLNLETGTLNYLIRSFRASGTEISNYSDKTKAQSSMDTKTLDH